MPKSQQQTIEYPWRYGFVIAAVMLVSVIIAGRSVHLHVYKGDFLRDEGSKRSLRTIEIAANRGMILDRNGSPLAVATPLTSLEINPQHVLSAWNQAKANDKLLEDPALQTYEQQFLDRWKTAAVIAEVDFGKLMHGIELKAQQGSQFMYLKRWMEPLLAEKVLSLKLMGVNDEHEPKRYYPAANVVSHVVGITHLNKDGRQVGQEGLEYALEQRLAGVKGSRTVVQDRRGYMIEDLGIKRAAKAGENIRLSIDLRAQYLAYRELATAVEVNKASAGCVVAIDVKTGELIALVNYPSYNPNDRTNLSYDRLRNRAVTDLYEPGSTVKIFTAAAALESGQYKPDTKIDVNPWRVNGKRISDHRNYRELSLTGVITKSSNVGVSKIALSLSPGHLRDVLYRVGVAQPTMIGLPGERTGTVPSRERLRSIELATLSYGYGLSVTPLQLAAAYSVIANKGVKLPLSLFPVDQPMQGERVLSAQVAQALTAMLETVVSDQGTARKAQVPGYSVAGKTGTTHKTKNNEKGYDLGSYLSWFVGFAPVSDPQVVMVVMVDDPKGSQYYGGAVAGPVFSNVMGGLLRAKNIAPDLDTEMLLSHRDVLASLELKGGTWGRAQ